jgi:hypothetical protein
MEDGNCGVDGFWAPPYLPAEKLYVVLRTDATPLKAASLPCEGGLKIQPRGSSLSPLHPNKQILQIGNLLSQRHPFTGMRFQLEAKGWVGLNEEGDPLVAHIGIFPVVAFVSTLPKSGFQLTFTESQASHHLFERFDSVGRFFWLGAKVPQLLGSLSKDPRSEFVFGDPLETVFL